MTSAPAELTLTAVERWSFIGYDLAATHRFGTVLENVVINEDTRELDLNSDARTENTRAAYPLAFLDPEAGGIGGHPSKILFLSADAFGVLPPIARLSRDQARDIAAYLYERT